MISQHDINEGIMCQDEIAPLAGNILLYTQYSSCTVFHKVSQSCISRLRHENSEG